ncbi:MAG: aldehyde dehydrogenase family protein, partial [Deltaproteobacteria bacterium]
MIAFRVKGDYVGGKFRRVRGATRKIVSIDPGDSGRRTAAFPIHPPHIDLAIEAAVEAFPKWADTPIEERADYLRKFAAEVYNRRDDLAAMISTETGKPLWESRREVDMVKTQVESEIREGIRPVSPFRVGEVRFGVSGAARYAPLGAVAVLGAAISPVHLPCAHILPALLSGCTVVFKPSKLVPCTGQLLAEVFDEIELPAGVFNMVQGDAEYGQKVAEDPRLAGLYFTGTLEAGRQLLLVASRHPHRLVALQMGGVNLAVVCADAGLERAVAGC